MPPTAAETCFRPVAVTPTYNNAGTLIDVLTRIEKQGVPVVVVNDGSTDATAQRLAQWTREPRQIAVTVATHPANRGKSAALQTGFARARELGYTHALSIDTDGQLDPEQMPALLEVARHEPRALVIGYRDAANHDGPARSMLGRRLSNLGIRLACGARVEDSQCGMRVYPLPLVEAVACRGQHFVFETEIITRAAWAGCPIEQVPVTSRYFPPEQRVSHFRPVMDSIRCLRLHGRLLTRSIMPWPHRQLWPGPGVEALAPEPWWRRALSWLDPRRLWRDLRQDAVGRWSFATGLSLGTFIANLPIYGFQTLLSLYLARRLHLHPLPVVAGSHLSMPPIGPVLVIAAILVGHLVLEGRWPTAVSIEGRAGELLSVPGRVLLAWLVGSVFVGLACMATTFLGSLALLRLLPMAEDNAPAAQSPEPTTTRQRSAPQSTS